jgi:uncharacterized protein YndB with AHSA1/START domain
MPEERLEDISVERCIDLNASPDEVWAHLADGDLLSVWMGSPVSIEARRGGAITMDGPDSAETFGVVEEIIPRKRLQWAWRTDNGLPALVEIELEPLGNGTRLTIRETLLPWQVTEAPARQYLPRSSPWLPGSGMSPPTTHASAAA